METENVHLLNLARNLNNSIYLIYYLLFEFTVIDKNAECGGLDAAKKSAISTFRAKQTNLSNKIFFGKLNLHSIFVYYQ